MTPITKKIFLIFALIPSIAFSQIEITGIAKASIGSVEFANVILTDVNNVILAGTVTDENGFFKLTVNKGKYNLTISFIGYDDWTKKISAETIVDIGIVNLVESKNLLGEVIVKANKKLIERNADKLILNIENSFLKSGYDGVEILKRAPNIYIDGKDNILVKNELATILINGRKINLSGNELTNYIKNIDAINIRKIEIQTNPSAKSDANIQGGIINFILKKSEIGLRASIKSYYTQQGKYPLYYSSTSFNYGSKKWNFYGGLSYSDGEDNGIVKSSTIFKNKNRFYHENGSFIDASGQLTANIGATFETWKNQEVGLEFYSTFNDYKIESNSEIGIYVDNTLLDLGETYSPIEKYSNYLNTSFNYTIKMDTVGGELKFIVDHAIQDLNNNFNANTIYKQNYFDNIVERSETDFSTKMFSAQVDYNKTMDPIGELSLGTKISSTDRKNNTIAENLIDNVFETDNQRSSSFNFKENIYATYFTLSKKLWKKIDSKVGLRIESTHLKGVNLLSDKTTSKNYLDYFPSIFLSNELKKNQSISFSYTRRINRPNFSIINPYIIKINDFNYQIGNPDIEPQYSNKFELNFNFKKHSFSAYYNLTKNLIFGTYFLENDVTFYQSQNLGEGKITGLEYNFYGNIKKWWYLNSGVFLYNQDYQLPEKSVNHNTLYFNFNNDWTISKVWSINLSAKYSTSRISSNFTFQNSFGSDLMIQRTFLNNKLKLRFYINDLLNSNRDKNIGKYTDFDFSFYQKRNTQKFTIWLLYTIDSNNKVRDKRIKSSNEANQRL